MYNQRTMPDARTVPLIIAPTAFEYAVVHQALPPAGGDDTLPGTSIQGRCGAPEGAALRRWLAGRRVLCRQCGMGENQAAAFCQKLDTQLISSVTLVGWAGGLVPELGAGAVVCADAAVREGQPTLACQVLSLAGSRVGPVLTVPKALFSPAEKRRAHAVSGALPPAGGDDTLPGTSIQGWCGAPEGAALAVEMEAYPIARWAQQRGIPFYHVRMILDTVDEALPTVGGDEALLKQVARMPGLMVELWRLSRRVRALNPRLAALAVEIAMRLVGEN